MQDDCICFGMPCFLQSDSVRARCTVNVGVGVGDRNKYVTTRYIIDRCCGKGVCAPWSQHSIGLYLMWRIMLFIYYYYVLT